MNAPRTLFASLIVLSGCAPNTDGDPHLSLPAAGQPLTLQMRSRIEPGQEIERCRFFQAPPEGLWISGQRATYTPGSHHVLLFSTRYTDIPTRDLGGKERDTGGVFDCPEGAPADWDIDGVVGGAQSADAAPLESPPGIALHVEGGKVLLMNTHYLNASPRPIDTEAELALTLSDPATVQTEAGVLFFYNFWIRVPPLGDGEARMRCPIGRDVTLLDAQSHMHARGVGYEATLRLPDGSVAPLYTSSSWEDVPVETFAPGRPLPAGSAVDYRCLYHNNEDRTVLQGFTTHDEMCMFVGVYYPRDSALERCALDDSWWTSDFAATHVGHGATSCAATLDCFTRAPHDDAGDGFTQCIDASCPAAADALWAAERCRMFHAQGACDEACKSEPSDACTACLEQGCAVELAACRASGC